MNTLFGHLIAIEIKMIPEVVLSIKHNGKPLLCLNWF